MRLNTGSRVIGRYLVLPLVFSQPLFPDLFFRRAGRGLLDVYVITVNRHNHTELGKMGLVSTGIVRMECSCHIRHNISSRRQWKLCFIIR